MTGTEEVPVSDLLRHPTYTLNILTNSRRRTLRLRRRGEEDLILTTASRAEQEAEVLHSASAILAAVLRNPVIRSQVALEVIREAFPWVRFLPVEDLQEFVTELSEVLSAADALDNPAPAALAIHAWKATAEAYADPEVAEILQRGGTGDYGPVPEPPTQPSKAAKPRRQAQ